MAQQTTSSPPAIEFTFNKCHVMIRGHQGSSGWISSKMAVVDTDMGHSAGTSDHISMLYHVTNIHITVY